MKAKKKHKISIRPYVGLSLSAIALSPVATSAYEWPVRPRMAQHVVTATLAEYRSADGNDPAHFHSGVDIGEAGAAVYPVEGDTAFVRGQGVNIGHFRYYHLTSIPDSIHGRFVDTNTFIGTCTDHLHLGESSMRFTAPGLTLPPGGRWLNPLREGGLTPFDDFAPPVIQEARICRGASFSPPLTRIQRRLIMSGRDRTPEASSLLTVAEGTQTKEAE